MQYESPETLDAAVELLAAAKGDARVLAGGTDLLVQLRADMIEPDLLVDIKRIPEVHAITEKDGGFEVGAAVTGMELMEHPTFGKSWPGVLEGLELIGSYQIQGRCTMAGNLCNGSPAADSVPAMIAGDVTAKIVGPAGAREIPVADVPTGPGKNSLAKGEVIVSFVFPARPANSSDAYLRFIPRTELDIAVVGAGVNLTFDKDGTCTAAKIALGAVAPTVVVVDEAAKAIIGTKLDDEALAKMSAAASAACNPITDKRGTKEFRIKVAGVLAKRAVLIAKERAGV